MYNDEQNLYHYTYRKDGTEPGQRYDAKQPGVDEQLNNYRQQQEQAPQQPEMQSQGGQAPHKNGKNRVGLKIASLALVCALLGGLVGGGTAYLNAIPAVEKLYAETEGDEKTGLQIVARALTAPVKQIAANAGIDGSVVLEKVKNSKKVGYGFNALSETYVDMISAGIVDPTKVTRSALENAASIASTLLTTESLVADKPEPPAPAAPAPDMGGMY